MTTDPRPTIALTMGDPAGVGAEVIVKVLSRRDLRERARFVVFGLNELLAYASDLAETEPFWFRDRWGNGPRTYPHDVVVVDYDEYSFLDRRVQAASREGGEASMRFCIDAIEAAKAGLVDAVVTAPICKESWQMAEFPFPGHTELFAFKTGTRRYNMMFVAGSLRVALATCHLPLMGIWNRLNIGAVFQPIELLHHALRDWFDIKKPRIAVAGLNPHAGENGQFGDEETRIIGPAIEMARELGIEVEGPFPPDTVFLTARRRRMDAIVAMYHDQALIPLKLLAFDKAVNVTLGLPIIRTSPDHGTAFDIAWTNKAHTGSMLAAVELAIRLAKKRQKTLAATAPPVSPVPSA